MTRNIADILHISNMSVVKRLKALGCVNRAYIWVLLDLKEDNLLVHLRISVQMQQSDSF